MGFHSTIFAAAFAIILISSGVTGAPATKYENHTSWAGSKESCHCRVTLPGPSVAACGGSSVYQFMSILEQFLRGQCDVEDPCGRVTPPTLAALHDRYDFVVVGGGSAGAVLASRLSEVAEWRVLLVEAGVNEPTGSQVPGFLGDFQNTTIDWQYLTEPETHACLGYAEQRCFWPRGKVIGGTSVLNGMMYTRGNRRDYDHWEEQGNPGWSYEDILPYFLKSEDNAEAGEMDPGYHSVGGLLPVGRFPHHPKLAEDILQAAEEMGYRVGDLTGKRQGGFAIAQTNNRNGVRYSMARAFLRPALRRGNLHVLLNTTVARVLVSGDGERRAVGVEVITSEGTRRNITAAKEVVVSGGAVNSPHILLLSGIGNRTELEAVNVTVVHELPGVGRNLHNHVSFTLEFTINEAATRDLSWATAMEYMLHRGGPMSSTGLTQVTGFVNSKFANASEDAPDVQLFFGGYSASCSHSGLVGEPSSSSSSRRVVSISPTVIKPRSTGYLTLRDDHPLTHPRIYGRYLTEPADLLTLVDAIKIALNLTTAEALAQYNFTLVTTPVSGCEDLTFASDEYWECAVRRKTSPENHQAGSCKMGPASDPLAVVDARLRVHGVSGLRVVDASVMPRVVSGNTNGPIVMIAEKAADMIKQDWLLPNSTSTTTSVE